jgi:hypothetical protein
MNGDTVTASTMPLAYVAPNITMKPLRPRRFRIRTVASATRSTCGSACHGKLNRRAAGAA